MCVCKTKKKKEYAQQQYACCLHMAHTFPRLRTVHRALYKCLRDYITYVTVRDSWITLCYISTCFTSVSSIVTIRMVSVCVMTCMCGSSNMDGLCTITKG